MFMSHLPMHINRLFHLISSIDSIETRIVTNISDISVIKKLRNRKFKNKINRWINRCDNQYQNEKFSDM